MRDVRTMNHGLLQRNVLSLRYGIEGALVLGTALLALAIVVGGGAGILFLAGLLGVALVTLIAYRFPTLTIVLVIVLVKVLGKEAQDLVPEPVVGDIKLRYFDPMLLGIVLAMILKLLQRNRQLIQFLFHVFPLWTLFILWAIIQVGISLSDHGINAPGEFRTYYQQFLLVPYVVAFFRTSQGQWKLFRLMIVLTFLFIPLGIIKGGVLYGFSIGAYKKWISANANVGLLAGMIGVIVGVRQKTIRLSSTRMLLLLSLFMLFTVINSHRSVWLATGVAILLLLLLKQLSLSRQIQFALAVFSAMLIAGYLMTVFGIDIAAFVQERLMAFTAYEEDSTASWRYYLWLEALQKIRERPLTGAGLGLHFQLLDPQGNLITTSPHNLYITIAYQIGVVGLAFYLGFVAQLLWRFRSAVRRMITPVDQTILLSAAIALIATSMYYAAYVFSHITWIFVGIAVGVVIRLRREERLARTKEAKRRFV